MSQNKASVPRGQSSYTPPTRRPAAARQNRGPGGSVIAIAGLAVVLLLVVGLGYWLNQNPNAAPTPTVEPVVNVWEHSNSTVEAISVQNITSTTTVQFSNGSWRLTAPFEDEADELSIENVASTWKTLAATRKVDENPTDLGQYGLATPAITVTLVLSGVTPPDQKLFVGSATVDGGSYYVKIPASNAVYLVSNGTIEPVRTWLETPPKALPTATPLATEIIQTITPTPVVTETPANAAATNTPAAGANAPPTSTTAP